MNKLARITLFTLLTVVILGRVNSTDAQNKQSEGPFLYYYSREQGGFIAERADGSESHIIIEYTTQNTDSILTSAGWSPSGVRFVWRETTPYGGTSPAYIFEVGSGTTLNVLDGKPVARMAWSSAQDSLLVTVQTTDEQPYLYDVFVIDTESPQVSIQIREGNTQPQSIYDYLNWTPSGHFIVQYSQSNSQSTMDVISLSGEKNSRQFYRVDRECFIPSWSSNDQVLYINSETGSLVLEDFQNNESTDFLPPRGVIHRIDWSPDNKYALLYLAGECSRFMASEMALYLLSVDTGRIEPIIDGVEIPFNTSIPYQFTDFTTWSPNGEYVAVQLSDETLYLITIPTLQTTEVSPPTSGYIYHTTWLENNKLAFVWHSSTEPSSDIYIFDPEDNSRYALLSDSSFVSSQFISQFAFSDDLNYLAFSMTDVNILNLESRFVATIDLVELNGAPANVPLDLLWHPRYNWLIVYNAEGGRMLSVMNADGTVARSLPGFCGLPISCFGWMPEA